MSRRSIIELVLHLLFWGTVLFIFTHYSILRPYAKTDLGEIIAALLTAAAVYANYFLLFPKLYMKRCYGFYILAVLLVCVATSSVEFAMIKEQLYNCFRPVLIDNDLNWSEAKREEFRFTVVYQTRTMLFLRTSAFVLALFPILLYKETEAKYNASEQKRKEVVLKLQTRINNHFLMNVFDNIDSLIAEEPEKAGRMLLALKEMFHYSVITQNSAQVKIKNEIHFIQNYLKLEHLVYPDKEADFQIHSQNAYEDLKIPPMLFETLVNNAFRYSKRNSKIKIGLDFSNPKYVEFVCENLKVDVKYPFETTGVGLVNFEERLIEIYGSRYKKRVEETDELYRVELQVPRS